MMVSIVKRKVKQSLVERKGGSNLKDSLLKDVYNLYSFGEGSDSESSQEHDKM